MNKQFPDALHLARSLLIAHCDAHPYGAEAAEVVLVAMLKIDDDAAKIEALTAERDELRASLAASEASDAESIRMYRSARDERDELRKRLDDATPAPPAPGEWVEWHGGECPIADVIDHCVRLRIGAECRSSGSPRRWKWGHHGSGNDIIAYRIL